MRGDGGGLVCEDLFEAMRKESRPEEIVRVMCSSAHLSPRESQVRTGDQGGGRDPFDALLETCGRASLAPAHRDLSMGKVERWQFRLGTGPSGRDV